MKNSLVFIAACGALFFCCIENPFGGDDNISGGTRSLQGQINLNNGASAEGAYVWLEGFNLGARANSNGRFTVTLPPAASQGSGGATGVFQLYFFVANYTLKTAAIVTRNGAFVYDQGELDRNGELRNAKVLERFLRISTQVIPATVAASYSGTINVETTLEATIDTATVVFPNTLAGLLSAVLVRRAGSNEVLGIYEAVPNTAGVETQRIGRTAVKRSMSFNFLTRPLPPGDYEVIPYFLIRHQQVPALLLASLGGNAEQLGPGFLNLPVQREGGQLKVTQ